MHHTKHNAGFWILDEMARVGIKYLLNLVKVIM